MLEENSEKLKTESKRLVDEAANYLKNIDELSMEHSSTQNNKHHDQLQTGDLHWEHQWYDRSIRNIRKQKNRKCKQMHNHHQQQTQVMTGSTSYADKVKKGSNFTILGACIIGRIKRNEINKRTKGNFHLKSFRGEKCNVKPNLDRATSDGFFIHAQTNNVSMCKRTSDIADSIISVGEKCQDTVVRDVLRDLYTIDGFVFIDTKNLSDCDMWEDLLYLSYSMTFKLANNSFGTINKTLQNNSR